MEEKKSLQERMADAAEALRDGRAAEALRSGGSSLGNVIADGASAVKDGRAEKKLEAGAHAASQLGHSLVDEARKVVGNETVDGIGRATHSAAHAVHEAAVAGADAVTHATDAVAHSDAGKFAGEVAHSLWSGLKDSAKHVAHGVSEAAHTLHSPTEKKPETDPQDPTKP
jgi:hypothetical protein